MTDDDTVQTYPEWKAAAEAFATDPVPYGALLEHEWFYRAFGIEPPDLAPSVAEFQKRQLKYLSCFKAFEKWLLEEQQMALRSRHGVGYEIVKPSEQARFAMGDLSEQLSKNFRKAGGRLLHTRLDELTHEQRRDHADAMARLAHLRAMSQPKKVMSLPAYKGPEGQFSAPPGAQ